jgi:hypothetical protein
MKERNEIEMINETPALRRLGPNVSAALAANKATVAALALLFGGGLNALAAGSDKDNRAPEVPVTIAVPVGNKVHFHGFGMGVQIYTWNGANWGTAVPEATLFNGNGVVAIHFAGPTWESNSGSQVVGALPPKSATVDSNAIPWLRLQAVEESTHGPGIFANTTYIQRVNTTGGKAPSANGAFVGQVARVPYTADYFFYRKTND